VQPSNVRTKRESPRAWVEGRSEKRSEASVGGDLCVVYSLKKNRYQGIYIIDTLRKFQKNISPERGHVSPDALILFVF